jgi:PAS domain S-box-containing protein
MERISQNQWSSKEVARLLALVESDRRFYQQILAVLPVPLAVLSEDRTILTSNRAFRSLLGETKESLAGKRIEEAIGTSPSAARLIEKIRDVQVHKIESQDFSVEIRGRLLQASLAALSDWEDETSQTLLVLQTATQAPSALVSEQPLQARVVPVAQPEPAIRRKEAPKESAANLEAKLTERQQITAARAEAIQGLAARLAHDLNNPLMIITGYAEEMLGGIPADDPHRADAEQIMAATERIASITSQLLQVTRKQAKPPQRVDIAALLRKLKPQISEAAGNQIEVEIAATGNLAALADPSQLQDVILALASSNREDARARTSLQITCTAVDLDAANASPTLEPGRYTRMALHDNGKGFDANKSVGVFETILTRDGVTKERSAAAALARAYQLVREWGGDIVYTGEASVGTTFLVYLPFAEPGAAEEEPAIRSTVALRKAPPAEPPRPTVLVVDDEADIRSLIAKILRREKYNVLEAGNVEEGLAAAAAHKGSLDLLVSDVMLADRSGRELAEKLREKLPTLKVLYISGYTDDESVRSGIRPAGAKFLQKPFTLGALLGKVREALQ